MMNMLRLFTKIQITTDSEIRRVQRLIECEEEEEQRNVQMGVRRSSRIRNQRALRITDKQFQDHSMGQCNRVRGIAGKIPWMRK